MGGGRLAGQADEATAVTLRSASMMLCLIGVHSLLEYPLWYAYFLLPAGTFSAFHRVRSDEAWQLLEGGPVRLWLMPPTLDAVSAMTLGGGAPPREERHPEPRPPGGREASESGEQRTRPGGECLVRPALVGGKEVEDAAALAEGARRLGLPLHVALNSPCHTSELVSSQYRPSEASVENFMKLPW